MIGTATAWVSANRWWLAACAACGVSGFAAGRYAAPTRVVTRTETVIKEVEVVKWKERIVRVQGPVRIVEKRVTVPGPAGPTVTVERVVYRDPVTTTTDGQGTGASSSQTSTVTEKIVERDAPRVLVAATAGETLYQGQVLPPSWGALVGYRVAGPVWVLGQGEGGAGPASIRLGVGVSF